MHWGAHFRPPSDKRPFSLLESSAAGRARVSHDANTHAGTHFKLPVKGNKGHPPCNQPCKCRSSQGPLLHFFFAYGSEELLSSELDVLTTWEEGWGPTNHQSKSPSRDHSQKCSKSPGIILSNSSKGHSSEPFKEEPASPAPPGCPGGEPPAQSRHERTLSGYLLRALSIRASGRNTMATEEATHIY